MSFLRNKKLKIPEKRDLLLSHSEIPLSCYKYRLARYLHESLGDFYPD
jgi:hypothetical protein